MIRDPECTRCVLSNEAEGASRCVTFVGSDSADILIVTKAPLGPKSRSELDAYLTEAGWDLDRVAYTGATKCKVWGLDVNKTEIKACRSYLEQEVEIIGPKLIMALGNEALNACTGNSGIMKYRGHTLKFKGTETTVIPTIGPAMIARNPGHRDGFIADLRYVWAQLSSEAPSEGLGVRPRAVMTPDGLRALRDRLEVAEGAYVDVESNGFDEFRPDSTLVTWAITCWDPGDTGPRDVWAVPLWHEESPFVGNWQAVISKIGEWIRKLVARGGKLAAHNGKFDLRWLWQFGWEGIGLTFDTMLAAHLLNENRPKGLKPLARSILGVPPWDIDTTALAGTRLKKILGYNALDTWYGAKLYFHFREELIKNPRLGKLFKRMMIPASNVLTEAERQGIWVDRKALAANGAQVRAELADLELQLRRWVPNDYPEADLGEINFNASNFSRWLLFDHMKFPVLARGKSGAPSMAEDVMTTLRMQMAQVNDKRASFLDLMIKRATLNKTVTAFFNPYDELVDERDRIHTTFKITGTVTGRLASGKGDADKVTGRVQNRGVNLQQVPRDKMVRTIFGAPPGKWFVECDYSQIELRVAAFLANEPTMKRLYQTGQDIHMAMAMRLTGKPESMITKEERKRAKSVNFGFLYGMSWGKYIKTAWSNYELIVSEGEAQAFRMSFFNEFSGLLGWHNRQRRLAHKYKRVETALGRVRHLPDIDSQVKEVRAEAERQAINSPVQGFASDLTLLSLVTLDRLFKERRMATRGVGTVHDAILFEVPEAEVAVAVPIIKKVMENLPLERWFGVHMDVPIIADATVGQRWAMGTEVPNEVARSPKGMERWLSNL